VALMARDGMAASLRRRSIQGRPSPRLPTAVPDRRALRRKDPGS
jgi:hypothetical protein